MQLFSLPDHLLDRVLCNACNNYLSVPPISSTLDGNAICGRCVDVNIPQNTRNQVFETLLEILSFPCMNNRYGCLEVRTGKSIKNHEISCLYRRINCPLASIKACEWIGDIETILEHFEDNHANELMQEPLFEMNFLDDFEGINILPYSDCLFLVKRHGDTEKKKFWVSLQAIQKNEADQYNFCLTLKNPASGKTRKFKEKKMNSLRDEDGFEISTDEIQEYLQNPSIVVASVDITEFNENSDGVVLLESLSNADLEMLKAIECPICFEYMVPPIFQCEIGHSICGKCKDVIKQCPTCERPFGDVQNFAVETITAFLKYPCKNNEEGCTFIATAKTIKQHENSCQFGEFNCPTSDYTSCKWNGLQKNIWEHCKKSHKDNLIECSSVSLLFDPNEDKDDEDCFIINYKKKIFLLHWKYVDKVFYWSVQLVGPSEESKRYYFDLEIIDRSGRNLRFFIRSTCEAYSDKYLAFQDNRTFVFLNLDQVKPFINEVFSFKPSVFRYKSDIY